MKDKFNFELDQIRKMWGLSQGTTLILDGLAIIPVGYMLILKTPVNDNKAKA